MSSRVCSLPQNYIARHGTAIKREPFAGIVYLPAAARNRHSIPKLVETREQELHPIIDVVKQRHYELIIDIGSGDGYYAVALARLLQTRALAYEPEATARMLCRQMAAQNRVENLVEFATFSCPGTSPPSAVSDAEGFESELFTQDTIEYTSNWDLVIELHGDNNKRLPALSWPHKTTVISQEEREGQYPELNGIGTKEKTSFPNIAAIRYSVGFGAIVSLTNHSILWNEFHESAQAI